MDCHWVTCVFAEDGGRKSEDGARWLGVRKHGRHTQERITTSGRCKPLLRNSRWQATICGRLGYAECSPKRDEGEDLHSVLLQVANVGPRPVALPTRCAKKRNGRIHPG